MELKTKELLLIQGGSLKTHIKQVFRFFHILYLMNKLFVN